MSMGRQVIMATLACSCSGMPNIVSQTEKGVFTFTGSLLIPIPGIGDGNISSTGTMDYFIDTDMGNARLDVHMDADEDDPASDQGYLLSGNEKRLYSYDSTGDGCSFLEFPELPEPAQYFGCVEDMLARGKKLFEDVYSIKDEAKETKLGPVTLGGGYVLGVHVEKDGGIRNLDFGGSLDLLKIPAFIYGGGFKASTTSLAKPDAKLFDLPAAWGECTKAEDPFSRLDDFTKTEQALLKCFTSASSDTFDVALV